MDVAVTGAAGPVGRRLLPALAAVPSIGRVLALDAAEVAAPRGVAAGVVDVRDPTLGQRLGGIDVLVHLGIGDDPHASDAAMRDRNVTGTTTAVDAALAAGVRRVVVVTSTSVYGAAADNDVPLSESSPRLATVDAPGARHVAEVEDQLWERATHLPAGATLTVLRPAPVVGGGVDGPLQQLLGSPRIPLVGGHRPPVQLLHVDDLVSALVLAVTTDLSGAYNVASPGWVSLEEAAAVVDRRTVPVGEEVARAAADALWRLGVTAGRGTRVDHLMHPCVVDVRRLQAAGWAPQHSNRDVLAALAAEVGPYVRVGGARLRRDRVVAAALATVAGAVSLAGAIALRRRR